MPKVSVIVPIHNVKRHLIKCLNSLISQTLKDIEIIIIDYGKTNNSQKILNKYSKKYNQIKVFKIKNNGLSNARNVGIDNAKGEFIKFVDADDYLRTNTLEKMYNIAKANNVLLVRGDYQTILGPIRMKDKCSFSNITCNGIININKNKDYIVTETPGIGNKLISKDLIKNIRFPENTKWEDLAIIPLIMINSKKIYHMGEPVYNYRININTTIKDFIYKIPNILDIILCVENIEKQLTASGLFEEYKEQIKSLFILHTLFRIENAMFWINFPRKKKEIVISSLLAILDDKYPGWEKDKIVALYKSKNRLFNFDINRIAKYNNNKYRNVDRKTAEKNIYNSFHDKHL